MLIRLSNGYKSTFKSLYTLAKNWKHNVIANVPIKCNFHRMNVERPVDNNENHNDKRQQLDDL